jgi:hypothetical protein
MLREWGVVLVLKEARGGLGANEPLVSWRAGEDRFDEGKGARPGVTGRETKY